MTSAAAHRATPVVAAPTAPRPTTVRTPAAVAAATAAPVVEVETPGIRTSPVVAWAVRRSPQGRASIVLGGGGGAGSDNNAVLQSGGGAGGGIVFVRAGSLSGTGSIVANGNNGQISGQDGSGGGGAGGTVVVVTSVTGAASGLSGLTITARGGAGGDETKFRPTRSGWRGRWGPSSRRGSRRPHRTCPPASTDVHVATSTPTAPARFLGVTSSPRSRRFPAHDTGSRASTSR